MNTKKRTKKDYLKWALPVAGIVVIAVVVYFASTTKTFLSYDPEWPTLKKFAMLKTWLSPDADFIAVADLKRIDQMSSLAKFLENGLFKGEDMIIKAVRTLLGPKATIGMMAMNAKLKGAGEAPSFSLIVQGDFGKMSLLNSIKEELAKENVTLASEAVGASTIYWQDGVETPFAFVLPDENHLIIGTKASIEEMLGSPGDEKTEPLETMDSPFFGMLKSSNRIKEILPPQIASLELARFNTDDVGGLHISIKLPDEQQANNLQAFLQGMKALYMLQLEGKPEMQKSIDSIVVTQEGSTLRVDTPIEPLFNVSAISMPQN